MQNDPLIILTTVPRRKIADALADMLVNRNLAACVNILPKGVSYYKWEGKLQREEEYNILIKTIKYNELDIYNEIKMHHPYKVPEIISITPSHCDSKYLEWIESVVSGA
jgi:periplasmic divalent cation tolerance protein